MTALRKVFFPLVSLSFLFAFLLVLASCSTKKNNFFTRSFHTVTSYYNVYWNGTEALKDVQFILKEKVPDNYFQVLPILKVGEVQDTSLTSEKTNRVIEKAAKSIKKHSIIDRGVERVKYIDDAYLLMAKGLFFQHEYSKSRMVLNVVLSDFAKNPERFDAMLWVARTYIQEKEYGMAFGLISKVEQLKESAKKKTQIELPQIQAEYYLSREEYDKAEPFLKEALSVVKDRDQRARICFILGQISQQKNHLTDAYNHYKECLKLNPPLAMSFNANFNRALCYDPRITSSKDIVKALQKLLKDQKNAVYFGRIYYVLGEIYFTDKNELAGVDYMNKSIQASEGDPQRMLLAAKKLAVYFYDKANYIESFKYYEMAAKVVAENDVDYYDITSRCKYLKELVQYYNALTQADTAMMISSMSEGERLAYGKKKAQEYKKKQEEERKKAAAEAAANAAGGVNSSSSSWYFYNSQARGVGYNEFTRRWGRRKSEDLWCFASKPPMATLRSMQQQMENDLSEEIEDTVKAITPEDPAYYLQNIAEGDTAIRRLDSIIEDGLFHVGLVYFDYLDEDKQGEKYFLRLITEYPKSRYISSAYENLCKIYHKRGNKELYEKYAQLLAKQYPGTEQDQRINDPLYQKKMEEGEKQITKWYEQAYDLFDKGRYAQMMSLVEQIEKKYPINSFKPQLMFLRAVGLAHTSGYAEMITLLENFKNSYPGHGLTERIDVLLERAKREVKKMNKPKEESPIKSVDSLARVPVSTEVVREVQEVTYAKKKVSSIHYVCFVMPKDKVNKEVLLVKMSDFNRKFYNEEGIELSAQDLAPSRILFLAASFKNAKSAMEYSKNISSNEYVFSGVNKQDGFLFVISEENLGLLRKSNNVEAYKLYFETNY